MTHLIKNSSAGTSIKIRPPATIKSYLIEPAKQKARRSTIIKSNSIVKKISGEMSSVIAHELRNPLTNINLAVQMLEYIDADDEHKQFLDIIKRGAKKINMLIGEFLNSGRTVEVLVEEECSLQEMLTEILDANKDRICLRKIEVITDFQKENDKILLQLSPMKLAFTNMIVNAIEAMKPAKGILTISTGLRKNRWQVIIADNGCGISAENLNYIFKPYFTNKVGGLGLGLSATSAILADNKVDVNVESVEGAGTKFILWFAEH